jgi:hypothetical protein
MAKSLIILVTALAVSGFSTEGLARGGGGGGGGHNVDGFSKSAQPSPSTAKAATGTASGKRQYKPISLTKEWGGASPLLRGNNTDRGKGGRYLAASAKTIPGKRKPRTFERNATPEKVEAGSENVRRAK